MGVHTKLSGNSRPAKKCKKVKGFTSQDALFSGQNDITCLKMFNTLGIILNRTMILSANRVKINVFSPKWQIGIPQRATEFIRVSKGLKDHVILWSSLAGKQCRRPCIHIKCIYYRPQTKLRKGNVFTSVCLGFCPQGGGGCLPPCTGWGVWPTPLGRHPPDGTCSGRYASYWNAFLFNKQITIFWIL